MNNLKSLEYLNLQECELETIPDFIKNLSNIKSIDLSKNYIKELPEWMTQTMSFIRIRLYGNPLKTTFIPPQFSY